MLLRCWARFRSWWGSDDTDDGDDDASGAAFSALDASVNFAHGEPRNGVRALQRANEYANELEEAHHEDR